MSEKSDGVTSAEGHEHVECISDMCGGLYGPGFWADIFQRPSGTRYVKLGGNWRYYDAPNAPRIIASTSPLYAGFLKACEADVEIQFVRDNF